MKLATDPRRDLSIFCLFGNIIPMLISKHVRFCEIA